MSAIPLRPGPDALRAYVTGDTSEPVLLSAFRGVDFDSRSELVNRHRSELESIDEARFVILESMLLSLEHRQS